METRQAAFIPLMAVLLLLPVSAFGNTWTVSAGGYWTNSATWGGMGTPGAGDTAVIGAGHSVTVDVSTVHLHGFTNQGNVVFWGTNTIIQATHILIAETGNITHPPQGATTTNASGEWCASHRVWLVASNLTISTGGRVNVDGKGYVGYYTGLNAQNRGAGPGGGGKNAGGGYGAPGGGLNGGVTYGSAAMPDEPGSGGGNGNGPAGGNGGGVIFIRATNLTVNGSITANGGGSSGGNYAGGGSGGSIRIRCGTFTGANGVVSARGSNGQANGGGGSGGRIAIEYDIPAQAAVNESARPTVVFAANGGGNGWNDRRYIGRPGTLYFSDASFFPTSVLQGGQPVIPEVTALTLDYLSVTNGMVVFQGFTVTVTNDLLVAGTYAGVEIADETLSVGGDVTVAAGILNVGSATLPRGIAVLSVGGDMLFTNAAWVGVYAGATNETAPDAYGALVSVTGTLSVVGDSWVYPWSDPTNGASPRFVVSNLVVVSTGGTNGGFNANGLGYGSNRDGATGFGPGRGNKDGGGGYGGFGGNYGTVNGTNYGWTYGSSNAPALPGSGGGGNVNATEYYGGRGGGLIRFDVADTARIDGVLRANGTKVSSGSGGSGGGIYLRSRIFQGAGSLAADGAVGGYNNHGGGGRIAVVDFLADSYAGAFSVAAGGGSGAAAGTVVRRALVTDWTMTVDGVPACYGVSSPYDYGNNGVNTGPVSVTAGAPEVDGMRYWVLGWAVTNALGGFVAEGAGSSATFTVTTNVALTWLWTNQYHLAVGAGANGDLAEDATGWYTNGVTVAVEALADPGYEFVQWVGPGVPPGQSADNPLVLTMDRAREITAVFDVVSGAPTIRTWIGTGTARWFDPSNWSPVGLPRPGDTAVFSSSAATALIEGEVSVQKLLLTNTFTGKLTFSNGVPANLLIGGDLYVKSGATIECTWSSRVGEGAGRAIHVGGNAVIDGTIDANGQGFAPLQGPGGGNTANHGGFGGEVASSVLYGSLTQPTALGSGGSAAIGGGAIRLAVSNTLTVNGQVRANSGAGDRPAAGGSVWITCGTLAGGGTVSANGGGGYSGSGGGRISIEHETNVFSGTVSVAGGNCYDYLHHSRGGQPGTLWQPGRFPRGSPDEPAGVIVNTGYQYWFPDTQPHYWNLTVTNSWWNEFHGGSLAVSNLALYGTVLRFDTNKLGQAAYSMDALSFQGGVMLTNAYLYWPPGSNAMAGDLDIRHGGVVYAMGRTNAINSASGGTSGKPHGAGMALSCANAWIRGTLSASGWGFSKGTGPGYHQQGGSYGGRAIQATGPVIYGNLERPTALGSGGHDGSAGSVDAGGGAILLDVRGELAIHGTISANGNGAMRGGSGGSLWLVCDTLTGGGTVSAIGGNGYYGAGGGRIAIESMDDSMFSGAIRVEGGKDQAGVVIKGLTGTVFRCRSPLRGAIAAGAYGLRLDSAFAPSSNDVQVARTVAEWRRGPQVEWTDAVAYVGGDARPGVGNYTLQGLNAGQKTQILIDGVPVAVLSADAHGVLAFDVELPEAATIRVEGLARGTLFLMR